MKVIKTIIGYTEDGTERLPDVVLDEDVHELVIENGECVIVIRGHRDGRFVILNKKEPMFSIVRRMFIEPISSDSILINQWVIKPESNEHES